MSSPALFLDRDGVLNIDKTYVYRYEDIEWMPGIVEIIKTANARNWKVIILTNQSGIGRGYYTKDDVNLLHQQMTSYLSKLGAQIDDWYYSDSLTDERRKPSPLMMLEAAKKHDIDLNKSIMLGDKISDLLDFVGPEYLLVRGHYPLEDAPENIKIFADLFEIKKYLETLNKL